MAQLKDTTVDGTLSVTGSTTSGGLLTGNSLKINGGQVEFYGADVQKKSLSDESYTPHIDFYYGGGDEAERTSRIIESSSGELDINGVEIIDNTIYANNLVVPNDCSIRSNESSGVAKGMMYMTTSDNLMAGVYGIELGHSGNTYVNSYNKRVYLRNKNRNLRWGEWTGEICDSILRPVADSKSMCGSSSYRWYRLYAASSTVLTSDEREKSDIMAIADYPVTYSRYGASNIFEQLFDKLKPKTYTLNVENNNEMHIGFIAQDIESSMEELGLSVDDLGFINHEYWTDEETGEEKDRYGLAYEEFIALNAYIIQKQKARIAELESQFAAQEERIDELEMLIDIN